jgi:hypothetical protein
MCIPKLVIILWTLGRFEKFQTWFKSSKKLKKGWRFYMWWIYLDQINICHIYEIWKLFFKSKFIDDILHEILGDNVLRW